MRRGSRRRARNPRCPALPRSGRWATGGRGSAADNQNNIIYSHNVKSRWGVQTSTKHHGVREEKEREGERERLERELVLCGVTQRICQNLWLASCQWVQRRGSSLSLSLSLSLFLSLISVKKSNLDLTSSVIIIWIIIIIIITFLFLQYKYSMTQLSTGERSAKVAR